MEAIFNIYGHCFEENYSFGIYYHADTNFPTTEELAVPFALQGMLKIRLELGQFKVATTPLAGPVVVKDYDHSPPGHYVYPPGEDVTVVGNAHIFVGSIRLATTSFLPTALLRAETMAFLLNLPPLDPDSCLMPVINRYAGGFEWQVDPIFPKLILLLLFFFFQLHPGTTRATPGETSAKMNL